MNTKSLLLVGTLALAGIASAKSYDITLAGPSKAGNVQLAAGEYSLKVEGTNAVFTNVDTGKSFTTAVKLEDAGKKFSQTAIDSTKQNDGEQITAIELGGSSTKLELGE